MCSSCCKGQFYCIFNAIIIFCARYLFFQKSRVLCCSGPLNLTRIARLSEAGEGDVEEKANLCILHLLGHEEAGIHECSGLGRARGRISSPGQI